MLLFKSFISTNENSYMRAFFEEPEIRCPICLGRVFTPVRPNCCTHVYCLYCLKKWNFTSKYALIYFVFCPSKRFAFVSSTIILINNTYVSDGLNFFNFSAISGLSPTLCCVHFW